MALTSRSRITCLRRWRRPEHGCRSRQQRPGSPRADALPSPGPRVSPSQGPRSRTTIAKLAGRAPRPRRKITPSDLGTDSLKLKHASTLGHHRRETALRRGRGTPSREKSPGVGMTSGAQPHLAGLVSRHRVGLRGVVTGFRAGMRRIYLGGAGSNSSRTRGVEWSPATRGAVRNPAPSSRPRLGLSLCFLPPFPSLPTSCLPPPVCGLPRPR